MVYVLMNIAILISLETLKLPDDPVTLDEVTRAASNFVVQNGLLYYADPDYSRLRSVVLLSGVHCFMIVVMDYSECTAAVGKCMKC